MFAHVLTFITGVVSIVSSLCLTSMPSTSLSNTANPKRATITYDESESVGFYVQQVYQRSSDNTDTLTFPTGMTLMDFSRWGYGIEVRFYVYDDNVMFQLRRFAINTLVRFRNYEIDLFNTDGHLISFGWSLDYFERNIFNKNMVYDLGITHYLDTDITTFNFDISFGDLSYNGTYILTDNFTGGLYYPPDNDVSSYSVITAPIYLDFNYHGITYEDGYDDGYDSGYSEGHGEGYQDGLDTGYENGYRDGVNADGLNINFLSLFGAIADTPVFIIRSLFSFDIFGISALTIFMTLTTVLIVIFFIRRFL